MAVSETFEWSTSADASEIFTQAPHPTTEAWKANAGKCLYLYLDESGNLDFGISGSKYFLMTCAVTTRPFTAAGKLRDIKFDLIETGKDIEKLHACEDSDATRTLVYNSLSESAGSYRVYTAYIDKALLNEREKTPDSVYSMVFEKLIDEIYRSEHLAWVERAIVTTDKLPKDATRKQVTKPLKRYMKEKFQTRHIPYSLFHRDSSSDMNLQAADYFCWAAHREITFGKDWPIKKVRGSFKQIGEIKTKKPIEP